MDGTRGAETAYCRCGLPGAFGRILTAAGRGPLGVATRAGAVAAVSVIAAVAHRFHDPGILCPVRALTGVPCPLCGGTTVFMELGAARPVGALLANPAVLVGTAGLVTAPLGTGRRWWAVRPRTRAWLLGVILALSWLWQLARFGLLRS